MFMRTSATNRRPAAAAAGLILSLVLGGACDTTREPARKSVADTVPNSPLAQTAEAPQPSCSNDLVPETKRVGGLPPIAAADDDTRTLPPEAKADLKKRIAAMEAQRATTRPAALVPSDIQRTRVARFLSEESALRTRFAADPTGFAKARAELKDQIILRGQ